MPDVCGLIVDGLIAAFASAWLGLAVGTATAIYLKVTFDLARGER
jgi:hypothetical protein